VRHGNCYPLTESTSQEANTMAKRMTTKRRSVMRKVRDLAMKPAVSKAVKGGSPVFYKVSATGKSLSVYQHNQTDLEFVR